MKICDLLIIKLSYEVNIVCGLGSINPKMSASPKLPLHHTAIIVNFHWKLSNQINFFFISFYFIELSECHENWLKFDHTRLTVREALEQLNELVDESDPDTTLPNIVHAFQTAERARAEFPEHDWLHLTALIHDAGKIMAFYGELKLRNICWNGHILNSTFPGEPQWAVVGDTFVGEFFFSMIFLVHRIT